MKSEQAQDLRNMLREAAKYLIDLRFIQANALVSMELEGKAYLAAKEYILKIKRLQERLEKAAIE